MIIWGSQAAVWQLRCQSSFILLLWMWLATLRNLVTHYYAYRWLLRDMVIDYSASIKTFGFHFSPITDLLSKVHIYVHNISACSLSTFWHNLIYVYCCWKRHNTSDGQVCVKCVLFESLVVRGWILWNIN